MSDLIRREDVAEALYQAIRTTLTSTFTDSMSLAIAMANNLPSAEPERKKGHWIDTDNYYQRWKCSECGCHTRDAEPNYCPHCGVKMTRGDLEDNPPLTWDELKLMIGKPVWVVRTEKYWGPHWAIVENVYKWDSINNSSAILQPEDEELFLSDQGKTWQAYRFENL